MKTRPVPTAPKASHSGHAKAEDGVVVIVAMVFVMIFTIIGLALYFLIASQTRATETERRDVRSFNVAEAGIDAGMLSLKLNWPHKSTDVAAVDETVLVDSLRAINSGLYLPDGANLETQVSKFLNVSLYDNVDAAGLVTDVAYPGAPRWDSNGDGKMFVDATADVDNDRHRILIMAERQLWDFSFPTSIALWAESVKSNGQGLTINFENGLPPAYYDVHDALHKGVNIPDPSLILPTAPQPFSSVLSEQMRVAIEKVARDNGTYFEGPTAGLDASNFLDNGDTLGAIVYVKSDVAVTLTGYEQVGSVAEPCVIIIETPSDAVNVWNYRGDLGFFGILITIGGNSLQGWNGVHGAMYCSKLLANDGTGRAGEINFNQQVIKNINQQYVLSVNIVPNTWEEYALPAATQ